MTHTAFVNVAHPDDKIPNLVNVADIVRVKPGLIESGWSGKDEACTIYLRIGLDEEYDNNRTMFGPYCFEVHLSTKEICRRLREEVFRV